MRVVGLVNGVSHPSCRYRLRAFEETLRNKGWELSLSALPHQWPARLPLLYRLGGSDVVLLQRRLLSRVELFILRRAARRLIYDFDDAVCYRSSNSLKGPYSRRRKSRFRATVQAADVVIAGNAFLATVAAACVSTDKVRMIPTCVDPAAYDALLKERNSRSGAELVWIGSRSTLQAILQIRAHFAAVAGAAPEVRLKIISDVFPESLPIAVVRCPWSPDTEVQALTSADIGVSWLPDDLWSQGKCGLKILQYMAAGLPVVANPVGVHRQMIRHGRTGFLVETEAEWAEAVRCLASDARLRDAMGAAARQTVQREYSPQVWAGELIRAISGEKSGEPPWA
ncbi:MAG TPA: glycosyltransferase family 4 protein [Candidatus Acidoferrales bacterium]|nr:glycosyltransferase family 4 protein [Candidatus Acidoferrales bacterium]